MGPLDGTAYFSNFVYREDDSLAFGAIPPADEPPGAILDWEVSRPFPLALIDLEKSPESQNLGDMAWKPLAAEPGGLVDVSRLYGRTSQPDLVFARKFAEAIHKQFPGKMLAYNCSPSFNWKKNLDDATIAKFQKELGAMGYKFQFITLAGFHSLNYSMFNLAHGYARNQMSAFVELQEAEFAAAEKGFTAVKHQREVGTGYFDAVTTTIERDASTAALKGSTEDEQFFDKKAASH